MKDFVTKIQILTIVVPICLVIIAGFARGKIDKLYYQFLEKLYSIKYQIPKHKLPVLYAESFKELSATLDIRPIPTNRHQLGNQVFMNLYDHCITNDFGLTHLSRANGFPTITKSWMFKQLSNTTPTNRDLKIVRDPAKIKCMSLIAVKKFSYTKPVDVAILTEFSHAKETLPAAQYTFIYKHLVDKGLKEISEILGIPKFYRRRSTVPSSSSTQTTPTYKSVCVASEPGNPQHAQHAQHAHHIPPQDHESDLQDIVYHSLYQYCVAKDIDLSDLTSRTTFPKITARWFKCKLAIAPTSPHDTDYVKDPANQKFRNLVAFKDYDHANPPDVEFLKLLYSHHTQLNQKDYKFIKNTVKRMHSPPTPLPPTENTIGAKQNVTVAISDYYATRRSTMNPSPARTKMRNKRLTSMEKKELAEQKGVSFLGEEPNHSFKVLGFGGHHLAIVDGEEDKTVSLPKYVLKNFVEAELGSKSRKRSQNNHTNRKSRIKRLLNPARVTVREQCIMLPTAKVLCIRSPTGKYQAVRLQRMTVDEKDAIHDELFASYESREANILRDLAEEELDDLNTCYV